LFGNPYDLELFKKSLKNTFVSLFFVIFALNLLFSLLTNTVNGNILPINGERIHLKTIFVVDDSDTNLAMAEEALEDHYNVMTMPSADRMFLLLEKMTPELILLDIEMPEMNGFEALEKLRNSKWSGIPVLFLTGTVNASIKEQSSKLGAVGIVEKPFSPDVLLDHVKPHIK
jgi:CheY-like chemotaxis protein